MENSIEVHQKTKNRAIPLLGIYPGKKPIGGKPEFRVVIVSHWLSGGGFSLAGVVAGQGENFLLLAVVN